MVMIYWLWDTNGCDGDNGILVLIMVYYKDSDDEIMMSCQQRWKASHMFKSQISSYQQILSQVMNILKKCEIMNILINILIQLE